LAALALLAVVSVSGSNTVSCLPKQLSDDALTNSSKQHVTRAVDDVENIFGHDLGVFPTQFK
jgi:hypothetical protein